jgi:hypothetical protein
MKLSAAFKASIALSSAMCPMLTNSSRVLRESRTIQIIEPICSTAGSPISITNETMPGFLTTSVAELPKDEQIMFREGAPAFRIKRNCWHTDPNFKYLEQAPPEPPTVTYKLARDDGSVKLSPEKTA